MSCDEERNLRHHKESSGDWNFAMLLFIVLSVITISLAVEYLSRGWFTSTLGLWIVTYFCNQQKLKHDKEIIILNAADSDSINKLTQ